METKNKFGLKEIVLGTALVIGSLSLKGCTGYQSQLNNLSYRINSSQLSEGEKREFKGILNSIDLKKLSDGEKKFLKLSLRKKREIIHREYSQEALNYLHNTGIMDKGKLSDIDCFYLGIAKIAAIKTSMQ